MKDPLLCARCSTPLNQYQGVYCSWACYRDVVRLPDRSCLYCAVAFHPGRRRQKLCSRPCATAYCLARLPRPKTGLYGMQKISRDLIAVLEAQRGDFWLTTSDLAIWVTGQDTPLAHHRVSSQILRLRRRGYRIESRIAVWESLGMRCPVAYRLVGAARSAEGMAA